MDQNTVTQKLSSILPDRDQLFTPVDHINRNEVIKDTSNRIVIKQDAKELAMARYKEKCRLEYEQEKLEKLQTRAEELGISQSDGATIKQLEKVAEQKAKLEVIEAIEEQNRSALDPNIIASKSNTQDVAAISTVVAKATQLQGTSRSDVTKLLTSLNINLNVRLSKTDTSNLLATLLTCNETQLNALMNNRKVPVVIKTVIKRLLEDSKLGNIDTIERLWDRVFGKTGMAEGQVVQDQTQQGILPNIPISREAYILIRDTLIK